MKGEVDVLSAEASAKVEAGLNLKEGDAFVGANVGLGAYVAGIGEVRRSFGVKALMAEATSAVLVLEQRLLRRGCRGFR